MAEYDTLKIKIEADSGEAKTSLQKFSSSLKTLNERIKELDVKSIEAVRGLLQSIAKIDFSNVTKGLQSVVSAFKSLERKSSSKGVGKAVGGAELQAPMQEYSPNFTMLQQELVAVDNQVGEANKGFEQMYYELDKVRKGFDSAFGEETQSKVVDEQKNVEDVAWTLNDIKEQLQGKGLTDEQISAVLRSIRKEMSLFNDSEIEQLRYTLIDMGINADMADKYIKNLKRDVEKLEGGAKKGTNGFKKLINQFSKIMKYRMIRKIIQEIYKALTEGIKNIIAFDQATADTVNSLKSKFEFVKNSLGAMIAPLIQLVAPVLEAIMTIVGDLANQFADMFAGFNGQEEFASAKDEVKDFNEELKKTKSLGIDELNVIQTEEASGGFEYKQTTEMSSDFKSVMTGITDILKDISPMLKLITSSFGELLKSIGMALNALMPILQVIIELVNGVLGNIAILVNKVLASVIKVIAKVIEIIATFYTFIEPVINLVNEVISFLVDIVTGVVDLLANLITTALQPILDILKVIFNTLSPILKFVTNLLKGLIDVIRGALGWLLDIQNGILGVVANLLGKIAPLLEAIINIFGFKWVDKTPPWARAIIGVATGGLSEIAHFLFSGHFATGGFPEDGFFYANHNELVGQFSNGKTAVANNAQITQGIHDAVLSAMRESGGLQGDIVINLDGNEIARVVTKKQKNFGNDLVAGANIKWGV